MCNETKDHNKEQLRNSFVTSENIYGTYKNKSLTYWILVFIQYIYIFKDSLLDQDRGLMTSVSLSLNLSDVLKISRRLSQSEPKKTKGDVTQKVVFLCWRRFDYLKDIEIWCPNFSNNKITTRKYWIILKDRVLIEKLILHTVLDL